MLAVEMLNKENIVKEPKKIEFFENDDIRKFIGRARGICWHKDRIHIDITAFCSMPLFQMPGL